MLVHLRIPINESGAWDKIVVKIDFGNLIDKLLVDVDCPVGGHPRVPAV
jgi:hypothetical protein